MEETLHQLDPNYVICLKYSKENITILSKELFNLGTSILTRPGHSIDTVYAFIRTEDNDNEIHNESNDGEEQENRSDNDATLVETRELDLYETLDKFDFVKSIIPLYGAKTSKQLNHFLRQQIAPKNLISLPTDSDLKKLKTLMRNDGLIEYFGFFKNYTKSLELLLIFGFLIRTVCGSLSWEFNPYYTTFLIIWNLYFTASWIYKVEPDYTNKLRLNTTTSGVHDVLNTSFNSPKTVLLRKCSFIPVALLFVSFLVTFQCLCFVVEIFITQFYSGPLVIILTLLPTVLISAFTPVLTTVFNRNFVDKFISWENGPNPMKSKMEKNFILTFFINYTPLLITMFIYLPLGYKFTPELKKSLAGWCLYFHIPITSSLFRVDPTRYRTQFFYFIVTNQLILLATQNIVPILIEILLPKITGEANPESEQSKISINMKSKFPKDYELWRTVRSYNIGPWGNFDLTVNREKLVIQFGFLVMFSPIWPLSPFICYVLNHIIIKADMWRAIKKCKPFILQTGEKQYLEDSIKPQPTRSWNVTMLIVSLLGATISSITTIMYRHCFLPDVGVATEFEKTELWYRYPPIPYSWSTILVFAIFSEHLSVLVYFFFSRFFESTKQKLNKGYVPTKGEKIVIQGRLSHLVAETDKFMTEESLLINNGKVKNDANINSDSEVNRLAFLKKDITVENSKFDGKSNNKGSIGDDWAIITESNRENKPNILRLGDQATANHGKGVDMITASNNKVERRRSSISHHFAGATIPDTIPTSKNYHFGEKRYTMKAKSLKHNPDVSVDPTQSIISGIARREPSISTLAKDKAHRSEKNFIEGSISTKAASTALTGTNVSSIEPCPPGEHVRLPQKQRNEALEKNIMMNKIEGNMTEVPTSSTTKRKSQGPSSLRSLTHSIKKTVSGNDASKKKSSNEQSTLTKKKNGIFSKIRQKI